MCGSHYCKLMREAKREASNSFCLCGCGGKTIPGFKYMRGHQTKTKASRDRMRDLYNKGAKTIRGSYLSISPSVGVTKYEHVHIAETAIGKQLPAGAEVHHVNGIKTENQNTNLVVCPNRSYHRLLHMRTRALDACGNANYIKCWICKKYDDPKNMYVRKNKGRHVACHKDYEKKRTA